MRYVLLVFGTAALAGAPRLAAAQDQPARTMTRAFAVAADHAVLGITLAADEGAGDSLGVRVEQVTDSGPAAKAGITAGSRIVAINGVDLRLSPADAKADDMRGVAARRLTRAMRAVKPGDEVELRVLANGQTRTVKVRTVKASELAGGWGGSGGPMRLRMASDDRATLGLTVRASGTVRDTLGAFVAGVVPGGPAEKAGVVEGTRVAAINGVDLRVAAPDTADQAVASTRAQRFARELARAKPGDDVELRVWSDGRYRTVKVKAARPSEVYRGDAWHMGMLEGMPMTPPVPRMRMAPTPAVPPGAPRPPRTRLLAPEGRVYLHMDADDIEGITDHAMRAAEAAVRAAEDAMIEVEPFGAVIDVEPFDAAFEVAPFDMAPVRVELRPVVRID